MASVDTRVVKMQFDNQQFEKGIQTSLTSIENLKKGLDFSGAAKGMDEIQKSANKIDLSVLGTAVESVKVKFSALEVMAITALQRITNQAIDTGTQLIKSMSSDNIAAGWSKYEKRMVATQTIMNATGKSVEEVDAALEKLTWYSDETSYDFTTMVESVGKFTSVGVDLEDAVTSMEGIANWAAASGVSTKNAERAFYNLSQAMGSGALKLQDWMSLESLVMITQEFKEQVVQTALEMGTLIDNGEQYISVTTNAQGKTTEFSKNLEGIRDSLSSGWITKDVIVATMAKYGEYADKIYEISDAYDTASEAMEAFGEEGYEFSAKVFKSAQVAKTWTDVVESVADAVSSKWQQTFLYIFGNYEESVALWTRWANELYDVFAASGDERNDWLAFWHDEGGYSAFWDGVFNLFYSISDIVGAVKEAWGLIFPSSAEKKGKALLSFTQKFLEFTEKIRPSEATLDRITRIFKGLFSILSIGKKILTPVVVFFQTLFRDLTKGVVSAENGGILEFLAGIADSITAFAESIKVWQTIADVMHSIYPSVIMAFKNLGKAISSFQDWLWDSGIVTAVGDWFVALWDSIKGGFSSVTQFITDGFSNWTTGINVLFGKDIPKIDISEAVDDGSLYEKIKNSKGHIYAEVLEMEKDLPSRAKRIADTIAKHAQSAARHIERSTDDSSEEMVSFFDQAQNFVQTRFPGLITFLTNIKDGVKNLFISLSEMFKEGDYKGILNLINSVLITGILAKFKNFLGGLKTVTDGVKDVLKIPTAIKDSFTRLIGKIGDTFKAWQSSIKADVIKKIAISIAILAGSLVVLSFVNEKDLQNAVGAITIVMLGLTAIITAFNKGNKNVIKKKNIKMMTATLFQLNSIGTTLVGIGVAVMAIAGAIAILGNMDFGTLIQGGLAVVIIMGILTAITVALDKLSKTLGKGQKLSSGITSLAAAMLVLAVALTALCAPIAILGHMDPTVLWTGGAAIIALTAVFALIATKMTKTLKYDERASTSLAAFAGGLLVLAVALTALCAPIAILGAMLTNHPIATGVAIIVIAGMVAGLAFLTKVIKPKAMATLGTTILALATSFGILAFSLQFLIPVLITMAAIGIDEFLVVMGSLVAVMASFFLMVKFIGPSADTSIYAISEAFMIFSVAILALSAAIYILGKAAQEGLLDSFISSILATRDAIPELAQLGIDIVVAVVKGLLEAVPELASAALEAILFSLRSLTDYVPAMVGEIANLIYMILVELEKYIRPIAEKATILLIDIIDGIGDAMKSRGLDSKGLIGMFAAIFAFTWIFSYLATIEQEAKKAFIAGALMAAVMAMFAAILIAVMAMPFDGALEAAAAMSLMVATMAGAMIIAVTLLKDIKAGEIAAVAGKFDLFIGIVSALFIGIAALLEGIERWTGNDGFVEGGMEKMVLFFTSIGEAIGGFVGGILGGVAEGFLTAICNTIPKFGQALADFWKKAKIFFEGVGNLDAGVWDGVKSIVGIILAMTAADIIEGIASFFGFGDKSLTDFGQMLEDFAPHLVAFADMVKDIDAEKTKNAAQAALALSEFANNLPARGGKLQEWLGEKDSLGDFGEELAKFGQPLVDFSHTVEGLNTESVPPAIEAATLVSEFAANLPKHGGAVQWITGDATLTSFANELVLFGPSLVLFSQIVKGTDNEAVEHGLIAAKMVADFEGSLPPHGGAIQWFTGDATLSTFAQGLADFGPQLAKFVKSVASASFYQMKQAISMAQMVADLENSLPASNGIMQLWFGGQDLTQFGVQLVLFGAAINGFALELGGIDQTKLDNAVSAAAKVKDLGTNMPEGSSLITKILGDENGNATMDWNQLGNGLADFGTAIVKFVGAFADSELSDTDVTNATNAASAIQGLAENMPETSSLMSKVLGTDDVKMDWIQLRTGLVGFGLAAKLFISTLGDVSDTDVESASNAATMIEDLATNMPETSSLMSKFIGTGDVKMDWVSLSFGLVGFGTAIKNFSEEVADVDYAALMRGTQMGTAVRNMANNMPTMTTFLGKFVNTESTMTWEDLGDGLVDFGGALADFTSTLKSTPPRNVDNAVTLTSKVGELADSLPTKKQMGLFQMVFGGERTLTWEEFGTGIQAMASAINQFATNVSDFGWNWIVDKAIESLERLINLEVILASLDNSTRLQSFISTLSVLALDGVQAFSDKFSTSTEDIQSSVNLFFRNYCLALQGIQGDVEEAARDIYDLILAVFNIEGNPIEEGKWKNAVSSGIIRPILQVFKADYTARNMSYAIGIMLDNMVDAVDSKAEEFKGAGENLASGLAEGIKSGVSVAKSAASNVAKRALNSLEQTLLIASPSKKTAEDGAYFVQGFVNGIRGALSLSDDTVEELGDNALDNMKSIIARAADVVSSDTDYEPRITPILDLSQIQNGVQTLNGMMGSRAYGIGASISYDRAKKVASEISVRSKNDSDLVREIRLLREDMSGYTNAAKNSKVVLDSGVLVGAMTPQIDRKLGQRTVYAGRRN